MGRLGGPALWLACALALLPIMHLQAAGEDGGGGDSGHGSRDCGIYVSFVMVGRVDDLRGDYVGRLRNGVEFLRALSVEAGLSAEIVVVEWNPFPGKPRLVDELRPSIFPIAPPDAPDAGGCPAPPVR
ncbi:hypothetical protein T484DRAFT_2025767, partial [Baffinella frigidus]